MKGKGRLLAAVVLLGLLAAGAAWRWWPGRGTHEPDQPGTPAEIRDPRLTFATPYRNVRPEVKYVGDQACARCHADEFASYRRHPMSRALAPVATAPAIERYEPAAFDPFVASGLHYSVERRVDQVFHRAWLADPPGMVLAEKEAEVRFAIGSASHGRAYLVNQDGYLFQSPITWYPQAGRWDLAPGYSQRNQHFGRPITPGCLFCHANAAEHVPNTVNRYRQPPFPDQAIGCERCHGPGELHIENPRGDGDGPAGLNATIVNPVRLDHVLREAVCQQCHLQGEQRVVARGRADFDYRPGLPLHLFLMDFVLHGERRDDLKFVGSVEQMAVSRCYRESREPKKLGCISCHDPHQFPAAEEKVAYYRQRCLHCHTENSCALPVATRHEKTKEDSCIVCHMPRTGSEVSHTSITDHRVPRRAEGPAAAPGQSTFPGAAALVPFHRELIASGDEETDRNQGIALMGLLERGPPEAAARQLAERALPLLERALERDRRDVAAWDAKGAALWCLGRQEEALAAYEKALAEAPEREATLHAAGNVAVALHRVDIGRSYLERALRVNPWNARYPYRLATASFQRAEWDRAVRECRQSLQLDPFNPGPRRLLVECSLRLGQPEQAQLEFATLLQLSPTDRRQELRDWFEQQRR